MKTNTRTILLIFASLLLSFSYYSTGYSQNKVIQDSIKDIFPPVTIPNTELRTLHSNLMDVDFNLYIKLPAGYLPDTGQVYPVWYFTDANRAFPLVANIASLMEFPKSDVRDMVIVNIGYPIRDISDWAAWRTRDLTPTNIPRVDSSWNSTLKEMTGRTYDVKSGGAPLFLEFIINELFPFIEANYRVSSDRGLGGYSYGGLFTFYALFKHPEAFSRYYAGSPSLAWDKGVLFRYEEEYAASHDDLNARVFMSIGKDEGEKSVANMQKMNDQLLSRNYPDLTIQFYTFPDMEHRSCIPASVMRAFLVLYSE